MEGKLNALLTGKKKIESRFHEYVVKAEMAGEQLDRYKLKIKKYQDKHCYFIWEKQIMFHFNILLYFCNYLFSCSIQIPIEVIRYILLLSLEYELDLLTSDFVPPCLNRECVIKWWKLSLTKQIYKPFDHKLYPFHCDNCHMCFDDKEKNETRSYTCLRCFTSFCFYCDKTSIGKQFKDYEFLCKSCIMDDFNRKWPEMTTIQKNNQYERFIDFDKRRKFKEYNNYFCK
jgi:hypothetical protein